MTLQDDFATFTDATTLEIARWLPGPVERIWPYLIDGNLRRQWLAAGELLPQAGSPLELVWRNDELSDDEDLRPDGFPPESRMQSRVIAIDAPHLLTIAWGEGDVTFKLSPKGERVLLTLTHRGLSSQSDRTMTAAGWHMHLAILRAILGNEARQSFWSGWTQLHRTYQARLPA